MLENMFFDVKAIFNNAPKLFIENHDGEPKCLQKDLIILNAFGKFPESQNINFISNSLLA